MKLVLQTETVVAWATVYKGLSLAVPKLRAFKPPDFPPESTCSVAREAMGVRPRSQPLLGEGSEGLTWPD